MCFSPRCKDPPTPLACRLPRQSSPKPQPSSRCPLPPASCWGDWITSRRRDKVGSPFPGAGGLRPLESRTAAASHVGWTVAPCCLHRDPVAGVLGPRLHREEGAWALLGREASSRPPCLPLGLRERLLPWLGPFHGWWALYSAPLLLWLWEWHLHRPQCLFLPGWRARGHLPRNPWILRGVWL